MTIAHRNVATERIVDDIVALAQTLNNASQAMQRRDNDLDSTVVLTLLDDEPPSRWTRVRRLVRRALTRAQRAIVTMVRVTVTRARTAATRLLHGLRLLPKTTRRYLYTGQHRSRRFIYGRERSTAEFNNIVARRARESRDAEGNLRFCNGDDVVSWVTRFIEVVREDNLIMHPEQPRHAVRYQC